MPRDLPPAAEAEWKRLFGGLTRRGTMTKVDSSAAEIYCVMFARWKKVAALADANPLVENTWVGSDGVEHTKIVENPASKIAARLESNLRAMLQQFSATPASREKTKPTAPPVKKDELVPGSMDWLAAEQARLEKQLAEENTAAESVEEETDGTVGAHR